MRKSLKRIDNEVYLKEEKTTTIYKDVSEADYFLAKHNLHNDEEYALQVLSKYPCSKQLNIDYA